MRKTEIAAWTSDWSEQYKEVDQTGKESFVNMLVQKAAEWAARRNG